MTRAEEFLQLVEQETDECIDWPGATSKTGYGHYKLGGRTVMVHEEALRRRIPKPEEGRQWNAAHSKGCARKCLNYRHLAWKTPKENQADRIRDNTHSRGTACVTAKLTEDQVREIRRLYSTGTHTQEALGRMYGVTQYQISTIVRRKAWSWLEDI